jgi:hypothetical protein
MAVDQFLIGARRNALEQDELILGVLWSAPRGPGSFLEDRNSKRDGDLGRGIVSFSSTRRLPGCAGGARLRVANHRSSRDAEREIVEAMTDAGVWDHPDMAVPPAAIDAFAQAVAEGASPIDDVRSSAASRRHAVRILARRALRWALEERRLP